MASKPKVLNQEEEEGEEEEEVRAIESLGSKPIAVEAKTDEITEGEGRVNIKEYIGKIVLIRKFTINPTVKTSPDGSNKMMYVSYIDGCVIEDDDAVKDIVKERTVTNKVKDIIKKECKEMYFYSTSAGIAVSLNSYVRPALERGSVLMKIATKKSGYPQDTITLVNPFIS